MAVTKFYDFSVSGSMAVSADIGFPYDMLRYDGAWPRDDAAVKALNPKNWPDDLSKVSFNLRSYKKPTAERWRSMGWIVNEKEYWA